MIEQLTNELIKKTGDKKLAETFIQSYEKITLSFLSRDSKRILQNSGLFVESTLRISERLIFGKYTPINKTLKVDKIISELEKASGPDSLRIFIPRMCRIVYDFRSRKNAVHVNVSEATTADIELIHNISTWIVVEILKEFKVKNLNTIVGVLLTRKIPIVQAIDDVMYTTDPRLSGPERILVLLYSASAGLDTNDLQSGTEKKIRNKKHLNTTLNRLSNAEKIVKKKDGRWILFGIGYKQAEEIIEKYSVS